MSDRAGTLAAWNCSQCGVINFVRDDEPEVCGKCGTRRPTPGGTE